MSNEQNADGVPTDERAAFEDAVAHVIYSPNLSRRENAEPKGDYWDREVRIAWAMWQARAMLAAAPASVPGRYWVDYDNETGPIGDCLVEWWSVIDEQTGDALCKCDDQASADRIAALLNSAPAPAEG